jgi:hypothetical protein
VSRGVWVWETRWVLKPSNVLRSIGKEILTSYLTIIVLEKAGLAGTYSTQLGFLQLLAFYIIRPRVAPFTGLLGFFQGFSQTGLADLFADGILSFVAGTSILVPFWFLFLPQSNPAAPAQALKIVATGTLLSAAPAYLFFFAILLLSLFLGLMGNNLLLSILLFLIVPLLIAVFLVLLPILGVMELVAMGVVGSCGCSRSCLRTVRRPGGRSPWRSPARSSASSTRSRCRAASSLMSGTGSSLRATSSWRARCSARRTSARSQPSGCSCRWRSTWCITRTGG